MMVLQVNNTDRVGGAAVAALRLTKALQVEGIESNLLVQKKETGFQLVIGASNKFKEFTYLLRPTLASYKLNKRAKGPFSGMGLHTDTVQRINSIIPDIVHLHWINHGFIRIEKLVNIRAPLVWTMHDSWAFTGGCHLPGECDRYIDCCGKCPVIGSSQQNDLSMKIHRRKNKLFSNKKVTIICPSKWMYDNVKKSSLLAEARIVLIPNAIDTKIFQRVNKILVRKIFNLDASKIYLGFGAVSALSVSHKGFSYLLSALTDIYNDQINLREKIELLVFGSYGASDNSLYPFPVRFMGELRDEYSLVLFYNSCDVFVSPSLADNLPYTVMESLACGTPVAAFNIGGIPELISHKINGYVSSYMDTNDLAQGILWILENNKNEELSKNAVKSVAKFESSQVADAHLRLYNEILNS